MFAAMVNGFFDSIPDNIQYFPLVEPHCIRKYVFDETFNVLHINICSFVNKFDQFELFLASLNVNFSCIVIGESWFAEHTVLNNYYLDGFDLFYSSRSTLGGGVCVYVADRFETSDTVVQLPGSEALLLSISLRGQAILSLLAIYRTPSGELPSFLADLGAMVQTIKNKVIIVGDINIDLDPNNELDIHSINYQTLLSSLGFYNVILSPTRYGATKNSLIDHVLTNMAFSEIVAGTIDCSLSDHLPVFSCFPFQPVSSPELEIQSNTSKLDYQLLKEKLSAYDWQETLNYTDVNICFGSFVKALRDSITQCTTENHSAGSMKDKGGFRKPWMNSRLFSLVNKRSLLHKQYKQQPFNLKLRNRYRSFRNYVTNEISKTKTNFYTRKYEACKDNVNNKWRFLNEILKRGQKSTVGPSQLVMDAAILNNPVDIAECLNDHFINIGKDLASRLPDSEITPDSFMNNLNLSTIDLFYFSEIDQEELLLEIESLNTNKAVGYDLISVRILKDNKLALASVLTRIINMVITSSIFPDCMKIARVTPLFKKGCKSDPNNYRPISILPVVSKLIEKFLAKQITVFLEDNNLLSSSQFGFRKNKNTSKAISSILEKLYANFDESKTTHGIFLDLSKAFDTVNHKILIDNLIITSSLPIPAVSLKVI